MKQFVGLKKGIRKGTFFGVVLKEEQKRMVVLTNNNSLGGIIC